MKMKKQTMILMVVFCLATIAQARILRVNNVAGMAPYETIKAAVNAATDGDTIMVDGSPVTYEKTTLTKRVVLVGPGYQLIVNGNATEDGREAIVDGLILEAAGTVVTGMSIGGWYSIEIKAPRCIITRCSIGSWEGVILRKGADNCVFHQNFMTDNIGSDAYTYNHQITNNLMKEIATENICNSYIGYNTNFGTANSNPNLRNSSGNLVEHNIVNREKWGSTDGSNLYRDNVEITDFKYFDGSNTDKDASEATAKLPTSVSKNFGAFAGTDPYVLSGIPTGPVIEQLIAPVTVEEGSKMNVTIKLKAGK